MRLILLSLGAALLAACSNSTEPAETAVEPAADTTGEPAEAPGYERIDFAGKTATAEERAACEAAGGEVRPAGRLGYDNCIQQFDDAGDICSDGDECLGNCLVTGGRVDDGSDVTGQCAPDDHRFGCYQTITAGVADPAICVD